MPVVNRRDMLRALSMAVPSFALGESGKPLRISLAEWSVHRAIMGLKMTNLDFPRYAREAGHRGTGVRQRIVGRADAGLSGASENGDEADRDAVRADHVR